MGPIAINLATAFVTISPTTTGIQGAIGKAFSGADVEAEKAGKKSGGKFSAAIGGVLKKGALAVGTAAGATLAGAIFKGWNRLTAIENAEAKLKGLGQSGQQIAGIMKNVNKAVLGTAFGLDEAASAAAGAIGAGIKPGKQLTAFLTLTADAATQAGIDFNSMAQMMNKVAGQGRLTGNVVQQMAQNGLYVIPMLAKSYGVSQEAMTKMVSAGKVDAATFQKVLKENIGGSAQDSGKTTSGAFKNMGAALARFGADLLSGVYPIAKTVFGGITGFLNKMGVAVKSVGAFFKEHITIVKILGIAVLALTVFLIAYKAVQIAVGVATKIATVATGAWTGAQWLLNAALNANPLGLIIAGIVLLVGAIILAWNKSEGFRDVVVAVWAAIMAAVSAVVSWFAGPFAAFFTTTLPGIFSSAWNFMLKIVQTVWNAIASFFASALAAFVGFFTGIWNTISSIFASVWNSISSVAISVWGGISGFFSGAFSSFTGFFSDTWNGIVSTFSSIFGGIKDIASSIWDGVLGVFKDGVNAVTGFINTWFIDKINAVTGIFGISEIPHIPVWQESGGFLGQAGMPMLAKGGSVGKGFRTSGPMAIVGEGNPLYPELVIPTDPKYRDNARKLMKYGASKIPMYESGGVVGGPEKVESSTGVVGYILDHTLKPIMDGIKGILPKGFIGDWARGIMDKMYIGIQDFLGVKEEKGILGGLGDYQGGAGVEQWRDTALQALALAGQSAAWIDKLLMQMNSESGGNPHAINNWDINAQNGIPSKGLMQTIDPTFNAYAGPLAGRGVYDPLANIYAAIMYTLSQYGSLGIWSGKGYASGGITTGATLALIGEGKEQEALLPLSKLNALLAEPRGTTSSGMANTFNMYELGDPVANSVAVNRRLSSLAAV